MGISCPARMKRRRNTPRVLSSRARSASVFPTRDRLRDHHVQRFDRDVEQGLVVHFRARPGCRAHMRFLPGDDRNHVVLANDRGRRGLDDLAPATDAHDEDPDVPGQRLQSAQRSCSPGPGWSRGRPARRRIWRPRRRRAPARPRPRSLACMRAPSSRSVDPHQLRPDGRKEPDETGGADEIGHGVGDRNVVHQRGLFRVGNRQALDRLARGADHRGLRERPRQEPGSRPHVVAEKLCEPERREQAGDAQRRR